MHDTGYVIFSLDTEIAWGFFDKDATRARFFTPDGSRERESIRRVLAILDEFGIVGTWALVGHLFYERCENCTVCPLLDWQGRYSSFDQIYETAHPQWYAPEIVDLLLASQDRHEIAFHGYTHKIFDPATMTREEAQLEIDEWLRLGQRFGLRPRSVIFTRNTVGFLDLFEAAGFTSYRGAATRYWYRNTRLGKVLKTMDNLLGISAPPIYDLPADGDGIINLPSSQHLFSFNRKLELQLDRFHLHNLRMRRVVKGIRKAAQERKLIHLWAHPWEFQTEQDFAKLRYILSAAAEEIERGRLQSVSMADLTATLKGQSAPINPKVPMTL